MAIGHLKNKRGFKANSNIPGGSKPGTSKPVWPLFIKVMAEAVWRRWAGSIDAMIIDRTGMPEDQLWEELKVLLPGLEEWCAENRANTLKEWPGNVHNRVYKMYYSGTSARGHDHDPGTRATMSPEHWTHLVPSGHPWHDLHDKVLRGTPVILHWKKELAVKFRKTRRDKKA